MMGRGRGKRAGTMVINKSTKSSVGIGKKSIQPGQAIELTALEMENPGVTALMRQGMLRKIRPGVMVKRLVKKQPRILVVVHTLFRGGAEVSTMETHRQLKSLGCEQALLNIYVGDKDFHTMLTDEAKEVFDIYKDYRIADKAKVRTLVRDFVEKYNPDIVMYSLLREVPECLLDMADRPPVIQAMHSELGDSQWGYDPAGTDAVITVSRHMAEYVCKDMGVPEKKLFPVWNGINPDRFFSGKSLRKELGISDKAIVVGMVGSLNDLKRPMMGLEAFAKARRKNDHMIFAGNPNDQGNEIRDRIAELGLGKYVHVLGLREDVENVYATVDILLNCSTMEGLPMTIVEGMFAQIPIIASNVGGNPEIVKHNETGYIFKGDDEAALVTYLDRLLNDSKLRRTFGYNAYTRACEHFDIEKIAQQYLDVLRRFTLTADDLRCSVVMPCWNGEKWLDRAIWSVRRQTFGDFEFIIVDDGSNDGSTKVVENHMERDGRIKLIKLEHGGIVKALNAGIRASKTPLIARMDVDDEMVPNRLELQMAFMDENREIDVLGTQMLARSADGQDMGPMLMMPIDHAGILAAMPHQNPICHPTVMFRKAAWRKVKGYKGDGRCEDYRMWAEMLNKGCLFANLEEALLIYQHTHEDDTEYKIWRDSILPEIREIITEGVMASG